MSKQTVLDTFTKPAQHSFYVLRKEYASAGASTIVRGHLTGFDRIDGNEVLSNRIDSVSAADAVTLVLLAEGYVKTTRYIPYNPEPVRDPIFDGGRPALRCPCCEKSVPSVGTADTAALGFNQHCKALICTRCRAKAAIPRTYARCFVICGIRGLVIERNGRKIEIDNNKGTTAVCDSVREACETLDYDSAFFNPKS